jgi:hypothetical protein
MGLEEGSDVVVVTFLDGGAVPISRVVDENIDTAEAFLGFAYRGTALLGIGYVERDSEHAVGHRGSYIFDPGDVPCGNDGIVSGADDDSGECPAEAG